MIVVEYSRQATCPFSKKQVELIAAVAARHEPRIRGVVEVTVVGDAKIRSLNKQYRGKDKVTDVLSFAWGEDASMPSALLGQIYISYPQIKRQAADFSVTPHNEFIRMLAHGLLHIVGHDHVKKAEAATMFALQEKIVAAVVKKM